PTRRSPDLGRARVGDAAAAEHARPRVRVNGERSVGQAQPERIEPLVADRALETLLDLRIVAGDERGRDGVLDRRADELRADFDVANEPARGEAVDPGHDEQRHQEQRDRERYDETERESQGPKHISREYTPASEGPRIRLSAGRR